nr:cytadherence high molecular weight protein 2-like [Zootoca vivipara]
MPQKTLSQREPHRANLLTKPSLLENAAGGKGISAIDGSGAGATTSFTNGKPSLDGLTGKSPLSTISFGDHHANLCRGARPVCRIRPTSAVIQGGSVAHINRLQGELVRKRKECEDLKKQNKCLSNELHLERIFMKSESELGMRNLRNINHGLQTLVKEESYIQGLPKFLPFVEHYAFLSVRKNKVKINQARKPTGREFVVLSITVLWNKKHLANTVFTCSSAHQLKQKLNASQQTAAKYSKLVEEASLAQAEAEKGQAEAEAQGKLCQEQQEAVQLENISLKEETQQLKKKLTEMQQLLAQVEKAHFESQMKLERITMEREVIREEKRYLEHERNELKQKLKGTLEENLKCKESEISQRCRTEAAEEALEKATLLHYEAERGKRLLEREKEEKEKQCEMWMKKYSAMADLWQSQEEEKSRRQNKACQVKMKSYLLCINESNEHITVLRNEDGTPQRFVEGEQVCFSIPGVGNEEKAKSTDRILHRVVAPSSNLGHPQMCGLCPAELHEKTPARRGRKIIEYFWFPVDGNTEE